MSTEKPQQRITKTPLPNYTYHITEKNSTTYTRVPMEDDPTIMSISQPAAALRDDVLIAAKDVINGDRQKDYGPPRENFARIADYWTTYLRNKRGLDLDVTPSDVALLMVLMKVARSHESPTRDTFVDLAGYAALGYELALEEDE